MKEALFWEKKNDKIQCLLCPHKCVIGNGKRGICGVRENKDGILYSLIYGLASSICPDPIEKKPLYHFYPGSAVLSFGTVGCNFKCKHCQNWGISQATPESYFALEKITGEEILKLAKKYDCQGVAWTYNEPAIWYEFTYDCSKLAKEHGLYTIYVTNGYINEEPLRKISKYLDAMNIDVKAFKEDFYKEICSAKLEPVLRTCELAKELGIYIELTYLIIPNYNDPTEEIETFCKWVNERIGKDTAVHFSRFYPHYKMDSLPPTPISTLLRAYQLGSKYLDFLYLGNVPHGNYENTYCPNCKELLIERFGFSAEMINLKNSKCSKCDTKIPGIF
ncbi:MAG: AmmeMemoRadiSam system radical SAM enzyme [Candidatus Thermoplasmatota archaeon]|nr:AmmeMemoRadiSam system radical SAM enzyme [Candidatus Thermoplasmatota archaeon]